MDNREHKEAVQGGGGRGGGIEMTVAATNVVAIVMGA